MLDICVLRKIPISISDAEIDRILMYVTSYVKTGIQIKTIYK